MVDEGFIIDDSVNELDLVKDAYNKKREPSLYNLMIYPTYQCNLRCWYCIQDHRHLDMSQETVSRIKLHIERYLSSHDLKELYISWFGGEPLLRYDTIIEINSFAKELCKEKDMLFSTGITTNGTLLNTERIKQLHEVGNRFYQITIDGYREKHNKVKVMNNNSAFDSTLSNVKMILECTPDTECLLRINYDNETLNARKILTDLNQYFSDELRKRLKITAKKVWQVDELSLPPFYLSKFITSLNKQGFKASHYFHGMCYVNHIHFYTIFPDGSIGKCDNDNMDNAKGYINNQGDIVWKDTYRFYNFDHFSENSECTRCKHFPMCWGPCPKNSEYQLTHSGKILCDKTHVTEKINHDIINYVQNYE